MPPRTRSRMLTDAAAVRMLLANFKSLIQPAPKLFMQTSLPSLLIPGRRFHRVVFFAAGLYNIGWGVWSGIDPGWFFRISGIAELNHPAIFACLGMVIGLYGVLYLEVARRPERGWLIAAVGLLGKILGPIGLAVLIASGTWPASAIILCLTNDLLWWIPFGLYLRDAFPAFRDDLRTS